MNETKTEQLKGITAGVNTDSEGDFLYSMEELKNLAEACGIEVKGELTQNLPRTHPALYMGTGKVEELQHLVEQMEADVVIFDSELSPSQIRNLEKELDCEVIDRTMLILDIFGRRAKTKEAQLQVEMARLQYMLPRLVGTYVALGRQGGGSGFKNRGAGETKLELDRRKIESKISYLRKELAKISEQRTVQRRQRQKNNLPVAALVGYTNAGKSTVMNAMLGTYGGDGGEVFEKDMLFATLDTSVRSIELPDKKEFLLADTVGFVNKLPHHLVKAFRSTLEEAAFADVLVHVIDVSSPQFETMTDITEKTLADIGAENMPVVYVYNKADRAGIEYPQTAGDSVYISAKERAGISELTNKLKEYLFKDYVRCTLLIPFDEGEVVSYFNEHAAVLETEYEENGTKLTVECHRKDYEKFKSFVTG
ncbi:GTPase HflX [Domibacillus sp. DTU_2020_1001157_1_SI_ALB_TIR_016]|uniref:GTPase HflX n=1 Tax=Domibacillus sp. DTU_2020_1001157_1_SI_ALB_TIR_016 TaxID=3077789 RepID=UPI0028EAC1F4|nr:GTPase HflX [Domibacillus sp. DTU_2020_1001157_1_SI_ALB_TIR_016]WNS81393.1 GTPase HflX [Domibacillus sp. DTU_2020_1001157_1_SI_ALB_TIR_016]